ncbi:MAG: hypothetical protein U0359_25350 [Byssovorax sp.]
MGSKAGASRAIRLGVTALGATLLALALGELGLRALDRPRPAQIGWRAGAPIHPEAELNEMGFRGRRAHPGEARTVLLLGDSQVVAPRADFDEMPEILLAEALRDRVGKGIRVASIAASGWGQDQELLALEAHGEALAPRVVCLWLTPQNDLWNNTFPTNFPRDGAPKPTFWLEGESLRGPDLPWMTMYRRRSLRLLALYDGLRGEPPYPTDASWEARLPPAYRGPSVDPASLPSLRAALAERRGLREDEVPYFDGEDFASEKTHYSIAMVPESPRLRYAIALTRALLREIRAYCEARKIALLIFHTPMPRVAPDEPTAYRAGDRAVTLSDAAARAVVARVVEGFDALSIPDLPEDWMRGKRDAHLSDEANRRVMARLAEAVAPLLGAAR